jgi:hypothetical protein
LTLALRGTVNVPDGNDLALRHFHQQEITSRAGASFALLSRARRTAIAVRPSQRCLVASRSDATVEDAVVVKIITPSDKNTLPGTSLRRGGTAFHRGAFSTA